MEAGNIFNQAKDYLLSFIDSSTNFLQSNVQNEWMSKLLLIFFGLVFLFIGSKLTQKLTKFGMIVIGIILIIGTFLSFIPK